MAEISTELKEKLENAHYEVAGKHSAVSVCGWTKNSLRDRGVCYKEKFYGIQCHRCVQMSPTVAWCNHRCVYCWRVQDDWAIQMDSDVDEPSEIIEGCIKGQLRKLSGFKGTPGANLKKFGEAQKPLHFAISLTGEPTMYPKLPELILKLHERGLTSFLVTNGTIPEALIKLKERGALPTQLYLSLDSPDPEVYKRLDVPLIKDGWEKIQKTVELFPGFDTRRAIRITLVRGYNNKNAKGFAERVLKAQPHFVEVKSFMCVGGARNRLKPEHMLSHEETKAFAKELADELGWKIIDEAEPSRCVLIAKEDYRKTAGSKLGMLT